MTWFRRLIFWRKCEPTENDQVLIALETAFNKVEWAQEAMDQVIVLMDNHLRSHRHPSECDVLCFPESLIRYAHGLPKEDLYYVALMAMKYYYHCYAALRHERSN